MCGDPERFAGSRRHGARAAEPETCGAAAHGRGVPPRQRRQHLMRHHPLPRRGCALVVTRPRRLARPGRSRPRQPHRCPPRVRKLAYVSQSTGASSHSMLGISDVAHKPAAGAPGRPQGESGVAGSAACRRGGAAAQLQRAGSVLGSSSSGGRMQVPQYAAEWNGRALFFVWGLVCMGCYVWGCSRGRRCALHADRRVRHTCGGGPPEHRCEMAGRPRRQSGPRLRLFFSLSVFRCTIACLRIR